MTNKRKLLILSLFMVLGMSCMPNVESKAEEASGEQTSSASGLKDENAQRLKEVTAMDESGEISQVDDAGGVIEVPEISKYFRSGAGVKVVNFRTKDNAVTEYVEASTGVAGYTNGAYGADAAYLGTSNGKVKFLLSGVVGLVPADQVQVVDLSQVKVVSCYRNVNGSLLHYIAQDMTTPGHATSLNNGPAPAYLSAGTDYYSYDGHYFYTNYGTMTSDYQNNTRSHSVNPDRPYYNYYQYLPLRSRTGYSGDELNGILNSRVSESSKMRDTGSQFVSRQDIYGVNALIMSGIAANESDWGRSAICKSKNNLFGLNAVDSSAAASANTYASVDECIRQFANGWMSRGYLYPKDGRYKGGFLGNKGSGINVSYASDPYWGEKAANIAWSLDSNGGGRDNGRYTIGIKNTIASDHSNVNVRSADTTASASLYMTGTHSNYAVLVLDPQASNSFYRIQSDAVLNSGRTGVAPGVGEYNFDSMYAYISADYVSVANQGSIAAPAAKELDSVYISTPPSKTAYTEGETFAPAGMAVTARWNDGSESDVTSEITYPGISPETPLELGTTEVTVQFTDGNITKEAIQSITVKEKPIVNEVEINPAKVEMKPGESRTFGVSVTGTGNPSGEVAWSVEGASSAGTVISETGKLEIAADETADIVTVKAVSKVDSEKKAAAAVTVVKDIVQEPDENKPDEKNPDAGEPDENGPDVEGPETENPETEGPEANGPDSGNQIVEVKNEETGIMVNGKIPENSQLQVNAIPAEDEKYAHLTADSQLDNAKILGVYDIALMGDIPPGTSVQLVFPVDQAYNGLEAVILHYYTENNKEFKQTMTTTIASGNAKVQTNGFSPYVIAVKDAGKNETDDTGTTQEPPHLQQNNTLTPPAQSAENGNISEPEPTTENTVNPSNGDPAGKGENGTADTGKSKVVPTSTTNVVSPTAPLKAPKTGDTTHIVGWIILMAVSVIAIAVIFYIIRRKKK